DPRFDPHNVLSLIVGVSGTEQAAGDRTTNFIRRVWSGVGRVPGLKPLAALITCRLPATNGVSRFMYRAAHWSVLAMGLLPFIVPYSRDTFARCGFPFSADGTLPSRTLCPRPESRSLT